MIKLSRIKVAVLMLFLLLSLTGCGSSADGKTHLTFQIWDVYQRPGCRLCATLILPSILT